MKGENQNQNNLENNPQNSRSFQSFMETIIKVSLVLLLVFMCFRILKPFVLIVVWGLVIAIMISPLYNFILTRIKGRKKLAAFLTTFGLVAVLVFPAVFLTDSLLTGVSSVRGYLTSTTSYVPPPSEGVKSWPLVGEKLHDSWSHASENLSDFLKQYRAQLRSAGEWLLSTAGRTGVGILQFLFSIIISGFFLANSQSGNVFANRVGNKLAGEKGLKMVRDAESTIRSVGKGIIGVALIQSFLIGVGLIIAGVPGAALWALISLFLGIIQIGTLPVVIPVIIYGFYTMSTTGAVILMIWLILVSPLDNILKPIFLGRGAPVPMLVVFLGAIGGFISFGIIGLFLGAVLLSLGYQLLQLWLSGESSHEA